MEMQSSGDTTDLAELMRKKMEMGVESFSTRTFDNSSPLFKQFMNGSGSGMLGSSSLDGISLNSTSSRSQMFAGMNQSSSIETSISGGGSQELPEEVMQELRNRGLLKENGTQRITATAKKTMISSSSTAAMGMTRSMSSSTAGFPSSSTVSEVMPGGEEVALVSSSSNTPSLDLSMLPSPFRRAPFTFRNFEGPLWTDNISPMGNVMSLKDNRKTWDLSSDIKSKTKVSFSASQSQQLSYESINGNVR